MSRFDLERQESLKRMWQERRATATAMDESFIKHYKLANKAPTLVPFTPPNPKTSISGGFDADLVASVIPPVTVVLEGRSICHRISLHKHRSYQSFAKALRHMFVDENDPHHHHSDLDLSNAIPGHLIAYEDLENDLLLVGDLNWKDFVRVARRIRILPAKTKSRKQNQE